MLNCKLIFVKLVTMHKNAMMMKVSTINYPGITKFIISTVIKSVLNTDIYVKKLNNMQEASV